MNSLNLISQPSDLAAVLSTVSAIFPATAVVAACACICASCIYVHGAMRWLAVAKRVRVRPRPD